MKLKITVIVIAITCACALLFAHCAPSGRQRSDGRMPSTHATGGRLSMSTIDFISTTWDFLFSRNHRTPDQELPIRPADIAHFSHSGTNQLSVTWLGHSSLLINIDGFKVVTDPVFQKRITLVGPSRFNGEVPLAVDQLPEIDAVIISHDHYDHLNKFSIRLLEDQVRRFIVPIGVGARLEKWGVADHKIIELDWWQEHLLDGGLMVAATPSQHFSGRGLSDRNQTLWASWVVESRNHRIFFSGDSGYFDGFRKIGTVYGPFDMTFIECGAYNAAWSDVHMFPEQTVQAHLDLRGEVLHPIHWGTFNLALHPWYEPMERLSSAAAIEGIPTATPMAGETTILGERIPTAQWWRQSMPTDSDEISAQANHPVMTASKEGA